jgi:hypothetical protein
LPCNTERNDPRGRKHIKKHINRKVNGVDDIRQSTVVVEGRYSALCKLEHVTGAWLADQLSRLEVRYPEARVVFADSSALR